MSSRPRKRRSCSPMTSRRTFVTTLVVAAALSATAQAHRVGLSRGEYTVGRTDVTGKLTFARVELFALQNDPPLAAHSLDALGRALASRTRVGMAGLQCRGT